MKLKLVEGGYYKDGFGDIYGPITSEPLLLKYTSNQQFARKTKKWVGVLIYGNEWNQWDDYGNDTNEGFSYYDLIERVNRDGSPYKQTICLCNNANVFGHRKDCPKY